MEAQFILNETTPTAPGTVVSTATWANAAGYLTAGVCGPLDAYDALDVIAELVGATGGPLDVYLQTSRDDGATWYDAVHFAQLAAGAAPVVYRTTLARYAQATSDAPSVVGSGATPKLAAGTTLQGAWGSRARLVYVAGTSTTVGAHVKVTIAASKRGTR